MSLTSECVSGELWLLSLLNVSPISVRFCCWSLRIRLYMQAMATQNIKAVHDNMIINKNFILNMSASLLSPDNDPSFGESLTPGFITNL